jgi:hypothetical protein
MRGLGLALILVLGLFQPVYAAEQTSWPCPLNQKELDNLVGWSMTPKVSNPFDSTLSPEDAFRQADVIHYTLLYSFRAFRLRTFAIGYNINCNKSWAKRCTEFIVERGRMSAAVMKKPITSNIKSLESIQNETNDDILKQECDDLITHLKRLVAEIDRIFSDVDSTDLSRYDVISIKPFDITRLATIRDSLEEKKTELYSYYDSEETKRNLPWRDRLVAYYTAHIIDSVLVFLKTYHELVTRFNVAVEKELSTPCKIYMKISSEFIGKYLVIRVDGLYEHLDGLYATVKNKKLRSLLFEALRELALFEERVSPIVEEITDNLDY